MSKIIDRTVFGDALYDADIQWESLSEVVRTDYSGRGMYGENRFGWCSEPSVRRHLLDRPGSLTEKGVFDADLGGGRRVRSLDAD